MIVVLIIAGSVTCTFVPTLNAFFIYDRYAIMEGDYWRLFTGHLIHFSISHLVINLSVLVIVYEILGEDHFKKLEKILLYGIALIGPILFIIDPFLAYYGGTSGLSSAVFFFALIVLYQTTDGAIKHLYSYGLLICLIKTFLEIISNTSLFVSLPVGIHGVPLSHLCGYVIGIKESVPFKRLKKRSFSE